MLGGFNSWRERWREWAALRSLAGRFTDARSAPEQLHLQGPDACLCATLECIQTLLLVPSAENVARQQLESTLLE
jgi:hypothetical protein